MNGGGVRNTAITGDMTYKTCKQIHMFGNVACLQTVTGQQLLDALEWGARQAPDVQNGSFLHVSGVRYEIDPAVISTVQADTNDIWLGGPVGEYRVKNVQIYNRTSDAYEPLDLNAEYNLAGYNYTLRDLGGGYAMFDGAVNVLDYVMEDYMVLANYIQGFENHIIEAKNSPLNAKYAAFGVDYSEVTGFGRITLTEAAEEPEIVPQEPEIPEVTPTEPEIVPEEPEVTPEEPEEPEVTLVEPEAPKTADNGTVVSLAVLVLCGMTAAEIHRRRVYR
jgi:hypothetical protein